MPGILPMKVIKVGSNAQTRIAQACDRCRSKKIRCDGTRPCCSQCANVGFECKTSDKLSRRAFPRGYTESLEERVRSLEAEVRDLKELLDEKDEKIDMLSRIHSQSPYPIVSPRRPSSTSVELHRGPEAMKDKEETFRVLQSPHLVADNGTDSYFSGTSSSRSFIEAFRHKIQDAGRSADLVDSTKLLNSRVDDRNADAPLTPGSPTTWRAPPRVVSDQLINKYFQEWAPLFPVLHRPTFLRLYEKYIDDCDAITDKSSIAQLNLVFGIASLSTAASSSADIDSFESQWRAALDSVLNDSSLPTLQCLVLAQIYCMQKGELAKLLTYKGLSTTIAARLGLHQSQKRFALDILSCETRKKVFWTLFTIDSFSSVVLGLPKQIKDEDVHCEYPVDADDEYVSKCGFQPTLPGEYTKISSALALFKVARILSNVLEEIYPAKTSYDLSLNTLSNLSDKLDAWWNMLPQHLRLQFAQDKPSTGTITSRSPILSLVYHYIRVLIHRPAICSSTLGPRSHSSMLAVASSSKHIVQLIQLLDERDLSFSFCLNREEVLVLSGIGLLFQRIRLDPSSKMLKDNGKMICEVARILSHSRAPCAVSFEEAASSLLCLQSEQNTLPPVSAKSCISKPSEPVLRHDPKPSSPAQSSRDVNICAKERPVAVYDDANRTDSRKSSSTSVPSPIKAQRSTTSSSSPKLPSTFSSSVTSLPLSNEYNSAPCPKSEPARSPEKFPVQLDCQKSPSPSTVPTTWSSSMPPTPAHPMLKSKESFSQRNKVTNLDYLSFSNDANDETEPRPRTVKSEPRPTDWERLLSNIDNGSTNIFDACYGGRPVEALMDVHPLVRPKSNENDSSIWPSPASKTDDPWGISELWALSIPNPTHNMPAEHDARSRPTEVGLLACADRIGNLSSWDGSNDKDFTNVDWLSAMNDGSRSCSGHDGLSSTFVSAADGLNFGQSWEPALDLDPVPTK